ncbi:hypothetical protein [Paraburkholderia phytofirmans]|uniref:hypothetical protein n=1 Tax=Paraburkholderia phytofirmans TaxID=261302 RepID=UPI0011DF77BC|nr:hypothetical protein [Paraburkholderia phytofirmans]
MKKCAGVIHISRRMRIVSAAFGLQREMSKFPEKTTLNAVRREWGHPTAAALRLKFPGVQRMSEPADT